MVPTRDHFTKIIIYRITIMDLEPKQFASAISQICEEKGITEEKAMEIVEIALVSAYRKDYGKKGQNLKIEFDKVSGDMEVTLLKEVVDTIEVEDVLYIMENVSEEELSSVKTMASKEEKKEDIKAENSAGAEEGEKSVSQRRFNPEAHLTLEEARKIKPDVQLGEFLTFSMPKPEGFGRIAAQTAKQVILQRIREAEREAVYEEFKGKEGEIVNGIVQRIEKRVVYVDLGRAVGLIYPTEQIPGEEYKIGMRVKTYILKIEADSKEPVIVLSRAYENFVKKLFEMEVPEIFSGTVVIKAIAREAGSRTKISVEATESGIDPIGSCIGQRGTRVQTIINELNGEKIDVIEYNKNLVQYITNALSPAKVLDVDATESEFGNQARVKVPEDQLSLAIGKQGQNVRLAAKLTGWRIDVYADKVEEVKEDNVEENEGENLSDGGEVEVEGKEEEK